MQTQSSLLSGIWEMLDNAVDNMHTTKDADDLAYQKARARTLCEVLHPLMSPFYESPDDVVREALARFKARTGGEEHETPGLGEHIFDRNTRWDGISYSAAPAPKKSKRTGKSIPPSSLGSVRQGIDSGMFTVTQIAQMYDVSPDEVKEQLGIA